VVGSGFTASRAMADSVLIAGRRLHSVTEAAV